MEDHHGKSMDFPCLFPMEISGIGATQGTGRSARAGGNGTSPRAPPWCSHRRARADANLGFFYRVGASLWALSSKKGVSFNHENCDLSNKEINLMMIYLIN
jgi:hypothetical protein